MPNAQTPMEVTSVGANRVSQVMASSDVRVSKINSIIYTYICFVWIRADDASKYILCKIFVSDSLLGKDFLSVGSVSTLTLFITRKLPCGLNSYFLEFVNLF